MDSGTAKVRLLAGLGLLLEPVILVLLRCGITWKDFASVARQRFVAVATREFGIRGRPTNVSRVAILTGMDRREVQKLRDADTSSDADGGFMSKPTLVLEGWHRDGEFLDDGGAPRDLDIEGEQGSFSVLSKRYGPGIPVVAMIKELRAAGAIEQLGSGRVRVLKRAYIPRELGENQIRLWSSALNDHGATLEFNLCRAKDGPPRFERRALSLDVDRDALPEFREFLESEGQAFLERVDAWLETHRVPQGAGQPPASVRLGVGVYHIQDGEAVIRRDQ